MIKKKIIHDTYLKINSITKTLFIISRIEIRIRGNIENTFKFLYMYDIYMYKKSQIFVLLYQKYVSLTQNVTSALK